MARRALIVLAALTALAPLGCRSIGRFPTIDPSDYAYVYFNGTATQVLQYTMPQVESSVLQAMGDLGFKKIEKKLKENGSVWITALTLDNRPTIVTLRPRNVAMTKLSVLIGVGDEMAATALIQRTTLNFGTLQRVIMPMEPTLERRYNVVPPVPMPRAGPTSLPPMVPSEGAPRFAEPTDETAPAVPPTPGATGPFSTPGAVPSPMGDPAPPPPPPVADPAPDMAQASTAPRGG
jgi:Protein of unknown function (DUF3568)